MKRAFILISIFLLFSQSTPAQNCKHTDSYDFDRDYRCQELIQKIRDQRNTLYNVLGLSPDQQRLKDEIEQRRQEETKPYTDAFRCEKQKLRELAKTAYNSPEFKKQEKITHKAWKNMQKQFKKYDKEFTKILCSTQKAKYKEIVKLTKSDVRYCYLNRKCCKKDPYINTFGKADAKNVCEVCPKHKRPHILNQNCNN